MHVLALVLLGLWLWVLPVEAQLWSDVLDPSRAINWSNVGVSGGIPARTTICATLKPGVTAAQITSAIQSCPANQVVFLAAGTYNLTTGGIDFTGKSNVTLRGAGPDQTFLKFSSGVGCMHGANGICLRGDDGLYPLNPAHSANWTAGYAKGTTSITLDDTMGLQVGSLLVMDQLDDTDTDSGNIWVCSTANICSSEGDSNVRRAGRSQSQVVVVTGISGSTVRFTPGLYMPNWRSSQIPGAFWGNLTTFGVGIENLSADWSRAGGNIYAGIFVTNVRDWWVKNVRSIFANRAFVWSYGSTRGTIRDNYIFGTLVAESISYGIETDVSSDILVENNFADRVALPFPTGESVTGNVYGYNYSRNNWYVSGGNTHWMQATLYNHSSGISMHLFEGNIGTGFTADQIHGTANFTTLFRNRLDGWDVASDTSGLGKTQQTDAIDNYAFNRYFNYIGNVLGRGGFHTVYEYFPASTSDAGGTSIAKNIYVLGWSGNSQKYPTMPNDLLVRQNMMRWGNYDTVNNAVRFLSSEVPSGIGLFANPVPASQILPNSFYLPGQPYWWSTPWGTPAWPPIGPDVTSGNVVSGTGPSSTLGSHAHKIPAQLCYENTPIDPSYGGSNVLRFNATRCYSRGSGSTPLPIKPTNLKIQ